MRPGSNLPHTHFCPSLGTPGALALLFCASLGTSLLLSLLQDPTMGAPPGVLQALARAAARVGGWRLGVQLESELRIISE